MMDTWSIFKDKAQVQNVAFHFYIQSHQHSSKYHPQSPALPRECLPAAPCLASSTSHLAPLNNVFSADQGPGVWMSCSGLQWNLQAAGLRRGKGSVEVADFFHS